MVVFHLKSAASGFVDRAVNTIGADKDGPMLPLGRVHGVTAIIADFDVVRHFLIGNESMSNCIQNDVLDFGRYIEGYSLVYIDS